MSDVRFVGPLTRNERVFRPQRGPLRRRWIIRPDDLVVLDIATENLKLVPGGPNQPARLERAGPGAAFLTVTLPPQNLVEEAYFFDAKDEGYPLETPPGVSDIDADPNTEKKPLDPSPIPARLAGWSTLVFRVPDTKLPLDWTLESILAAMSELELNLAPNALPPRDPPGRLTDYLKETVFGFELVTAAVSAPVSGGAPTGGAPIGGMTAGTDGTAVTVGQAVIGAGLASAGPARPASIRGAINDRRLVRTIGHTLGLSEASGSATASYLDRAIAGGIDLAPILMKPAPRAPTDRETALELPYRLILSPNHHGAWFHSERAVTSEPTGHTELWHTRLGVRLDDGTLIDGPDPLRTVRAIWTTQLPTLKTPIGSSIPPSDNSDPFRASLDPADRHNVVHLSSNFQLPRPGNPKQFFEPQALEVDLLALSSLGAWLDTRGTWDEQPEGLEVEEWRHRATLGRDHYVRVVYAGRLFPLGHRASLVKVTERRFEKDVPGNPAYLRQRMFIIVREPLRMYGKSGWTSDGEKWDLKLPFTAMRITTRVSPLLDKPEHTEVAAGLNRQAFWPFVGEQPFRFHVVATDRSGAPVEFAMPLIFVGQAQADVDITDKQGEPTSIIPTSVVDQYDERTWPNSSQLLATVPLEGQKVAFAKPGVPGDTTFAVQSLTFGGEVPAKATFNAAEKRQPRYVPVIRATQLDVPSLQKIAQTDQPARLEYASTYLKHGFGATNAGEVFLAAVGDGVPQLSVSFSSRSERSGGLISPDITLSGLSRITGPVSGALDSAEQGSFNPSAWFGGIDKALLFGALELSDIIASTGFDMLDALPRFVGDTLDAVQKVIADLERLRLLLGTVSIPAATDANNLLDKLVDPTTGSILALLKGGDSGAIADQLADLRIELVDQLKPALAGAAIGAGPQAVLEQAIESLDPLLGAIDDDLLKAFAAADKLPEAFAARFDWRPVLETTNTFRPSDKRNLILSVDASGDELVTVCSLDSFELHLSVLRLKFERVQFRSRAGRKPEIDVEFTGFDFIGPLSFVDTLRQLIPLDGFSDPPEVDVTAEGIRAGFSQGLPNIAVGVFSLENLSLAAGFSVPFVGPPMTTWFRFCERENPARLTVSLFGGGFYFGVTVDAKDLQVVEGAFEFGAAIAVNFGVASGNVSAMAGLYFKIEGSAVKLGGYFRLRGVVRALGIVSVSVELYLEMNYEDGGGASGKVVGTATISVEIEVALWSTTIKLTATKKFAGSGPDPTLAETLNIAGNMTSTDWNEYCGAFAP